MKAKGYHTLALCFTILSGCNQDSEPAEIQATPTTPEPIFTEPDERKITDLRQSIVDTEQERDTLESEIQAMQQELSKIELELQEQMQQVEDLQTQALQNSD